MKKGDTGIKHKYYILVTELTRQVSSFFCLFLPWLGNITSKQVWNNFIISSSCAHLEVGWPLRLSCKSKVEV